MTTPAQSKLPVRVFVLMGQGGLSTSEGMRALEQRLAQLSPRLVCSLHDWNETQAVYKAITALPKGEAVILIGYSLGAGSIVSIAVALKRRAIALIVGYDPSVWQPPAPVPANVKRALCYHNSGFDLFGHARYQGKQVETVEVSQAHLLVDWNDSLHQRTFAAVKKVLAA